MSKTQGITEGNEQKKCSTLHANCHGVKVSLFSSEDDVPGEFSGGTIVSDFKELFFPDIDVLLEEYEKAEDSEHYDPCPECGTMKLLRADCPCCSYTITQAITASDVLESFILALACEGYDITHPKFLCALETTVDDIGNSYKV